MNIEKIKEKVKQNKHFVNNEDLLESFVDLATTRLNDIVDCINDEKTLNSLIERVVSKSIIDVLKNANRYKLKEVKRLQKVDYRSFCFDNTTHNTPSISITTLKQLYSTITKDDENDGKLFSIINLRYKEKKSLDEMSNELNLSKQEITNILFELSNYSYKVAKI